MQRVVSINLNGNAYQVEENGYNALFAYLDAIESAAKDSPDRAQKLADLERIIAEKCQACLAPHKTVVTSADVDRILLELAPAPDAQSSSTAAGSSSTDAKPPHQPSPSSSSSSHRRLFQIREGAMISGVCVGLSEYMHVDVTLIRILFVVFALASAGWGMLAYGVLMFIVPKVNTRGDASDGNAPAAVPPQHWPWDNGWPWDQPRRQRAQAREERRAMRMEHHPWPFGTVSMIFFLMLGFFWLSFWTRGHFFFGFPFFWGFPHWIGIIFFFMMLRLIFMPFRAARWYGYGPYWGYPYWGGAYYYGGWHGHSHGGHGHGGHGHGGYYGGHGHGGSHGGRGGHGAYHGGGGHGGHSGGGSHGGGHGGGHSGGGHGGHR
jgi:phage shock protein PspC (stress-responsive transcriptional regulator)